jgi:CheY-like chemotaxis protein
MPAAVVVVHDEPETCEAILRALSEAGLDAVGFTNPMAALDAVETDSELRVLVTRISFGPDKLNGLALYRIVHHKRATLRNQPPRAVFIGRADYREDAEQDGVFLLRGSEPLAVVEAVRRQLKADGAAQLRMVRGSIIWESPIEAPPIPIPHFSLRTDRLIREARRAVERATLALECRTIILHELSRIRTARRSA